LHVRDVNGTVGVCSSLRACSVLSPKPNSHVMHRPLTLASSRPAVAVAHLESVLIDRPQLSAADVAKLKAATRNHGRDP